MAIVYTTAHSTHLDWKPLLCVCVCVCACSACKELWSAVFVKKRICRIIRCGGSNPGLVDESHTS